MTLDEIRRLVDGARAGTFHPSPSAYIDHVSALLRAIDSLPMPERDHIADWVTLSRPVTVTSRNQSGEPDGSLNTAPGPSGKPSDTWTEAEMREAWGR